MFHHWKALFAAHSALVSNGKVLEILEWNLAKQTDISGRVALLDERRGSEGIEGIEGIRGRRKIDGSTTHRRINHGEKAAALF